MLSPIAAAVWSRGCGGAGRRKILPMHMSFDRLAPHYRWMEAALAGNLLQRCRTHWLPKVRGARKVLLIGEGNGRMLEACATMLPEGHLTVLDQSEAMLAQANRRWCRAGGKQNIVFQRADLREWHAIEPGFDLVVTNFFLDCFNAEELSEVITNIAAATTPSARWLLADFTVPAAGWRRIRARMVLSLAYNFFRLTTGISARRVTAPDKALGIAGFTLRQREWFNHELLHADLWARDN
jgi:ubiquinone/menaquinone biosynthesis C-methylase UbiE